MRSVSIFGATGSVGASCFDLLIRAGGPDAFHTVALSGGRNVARLAQMARALRAEIAVTAFEDELPALREALAGSGIEAAAGAQALEQAALRPADWTLSAIVGAAGLAPGMAALSRGGTLALANKNRWFARVACCARRRRATRRLFCRWILNIPPFFNLLAMKTWKMSRM